LPLNQWKHLTMVATADSTRLYIDGAAIDTIDASIPLPRKTIGGLHNGNYTGLRAPNAKLDELRIWDEALSARTVKTLHESYSDPNLGSLVHRWAFDEASGTVATDTGTQSAPGAINGAARVAVGRVGGSLEFGPGEPGTYSVLEPTGRNNFVSTGADPLAAANGWTAALWVKRTADTSRSNLFTSARGSTRAEVRLEVRTANRAVGIVKSGTEYDFGYTVPKDQWTHLALVGGASATVLYVNGVLQGTVSQAFDLPLATIGAGDRGWFSGVRGELCVGRPETGVVAVVEAAGGLPGRR